MGINCTYDPISLSFQIFFFFIHLSKYVKLDGELFQLHTKIRTPHHFEWEKVTE